MKITDDFIKALHSAISDSYDSIADFANCANVSTNTISKYLRRESFVIQKDTWNQLYPLISPYLPNKNGKVKYSIELSSDEKILLDAFNSLPDDVRGQKLMEIIALAKKNLSRQQTQHTNTP